MNSSPINPPPGDPVNFPAVLDVNQTAQLLRCEPTTVREHALRLGGVKFGRDWVFPGGALARRLDEIALANAAPPAAPAPAPMAVIPSARPATTGTRRTRRAPPVLPSLPG